MSQAVVDININEGVTFEMSLAYWENSDKTEPIDISTWLFKGALQVGTKCIPMTFTLIENSVTCRIEAAALIDLSSTGSYSIEAVAGVDTYRLQQGSIRIDRSAVCS